MDQFTVTYLKQPKTWTNFVLLTDHISPFEILFVLSVLITSLIKRRTYGNQLVSVQNALGFSIAHLVIVGATFLLATVIPPISMIRMAGASMLISSFLVVCLLSTFCSWAYGVWLGRTERDQFKRLDVPVAVLAILTVISS